MGIYLNFSSNKFHWFITEISYIQMLDLTWHLTKETMSTSMGIGTWGQGKGCLTYLWNYQMVPQLMLRVKSQYFFCFNFRKLIVVIERLTYKLFQFLVKHQLLKLKPVRENVHQWIWSRTKRLARRCVKQLNGHTRRESCPRCPSYAVALDLRWKERRLCSEYIDLFIFVTCLWSIA